MGSRRNTSPPAACCVNVYSRLKSTQARQGMLYPESMYSLQTSREVGIPGSGQCKDLSHPVPGQHSTLALGSELRAPRDASRVSWGEGMSSLLLEG